MAPWWPAKQPPSTEAPTITKASTLQTATDPHLITIKPSTNDIQSLASPIADILARTQRQGVAILSSDAVYRQAVDAAASSAALQMPVFKRPKSRSGRMKSRLRRAFLPKWVLTMVLGQTVAGWVYPWIHPKK